MREQDYVYDFEPGNFYRPAFAWGEQVDVLDDGTLKMSGRMKADVSSMMDVKQLGYSTDFIWVEMISIFKFVIM